MADWYKLHLRFHPEAPPEALAEALTDLLEEDEDFPAGSIGAAGVVGRYGSTGVLRGDPWTLYRSPVGHMREGSIPSILAKHGLAGTGWLVRDYGEDTRVERWACFEFGPRSATVQGIVEALQALPLAERRRLDIVLGEGPFDG